MATSRPQTATSADLAEAFGITPRQVQRLASEGKLTNHGRDNAYKFIWPEAVREYLSIREGGKSDDRELNSKKLKADAYYKTAKAAAAQLELAELEGTMHSAEDVQAFAEQFTYGVRSMLMALPGRMAVDVSNAANAAEAAEIIRAEINEVLNALSEYQYDPDFFSARVKDRRGWMGLIDDYTRAEGGKPQSHA